jgi:hypothetical protein
MRNGQNGCYYGTQCEFSLLCAGEVENCKGLTSEISQRLKPEQIAKRVCGRILSDENCSATSQKPDKIICNSRFGKCEPDFSGGYCKCNLINGNCYYGKTCNTKVVCTRDTVSCNVYVPTLNEPISINTLTSAVCKLSSRV